MRIPFLTIAGLLGLNIVCGDVQAFFEVSAMGTYKGYSSQASNGSTLFHPQVGARVAFFNRSRVALELRYGQAHAAFGSIAVTDHDLGTGLKLELDPSGSFAPFFLLGAGARVSRYSGAALPDEGSYSLGPYLGFGLRKTWGIFLIRADVVETLFLWQADSFLAMNFSLGISL